MSRLIMLGAGILIGGMCMYTAFHYHVVATAETYYFIPKQETQLADAYVNISEWGIAEWTDHPALAVAMQKAGHGDLVQQAVQKGLFDEVFDRIGVRPQTRQ